MKRIIDIVCFCSCVCLLLTFSSCEEKVNGNIEEKLSTPNATIKDQVANSFTVQWDEVDNATSYTCSLNGIEKEVEDLEVSYTNQPYGEHSFKVRANASNVEYNSDWSELDINLEKAPVASEWIVQTIYLEDDYDTGVSKQNSIWVNWKGNDVESLVYSVFLTSDVQGFSDSEIISILQNDGYEIPYNQLDNLYLEKGLTGTFSNLKSDTSYSIYSYSINKDGAKMLIRQSLTTEKHTEIMEHYAKWLGNWTVSTSRELVIEEGVAVIKENGQMWDISIDENEINTTYKVTGWSKSLSEETIVANFDLANKCVLLPNEYEVHPKNDEGFSAMFLGYATVEMEQTIIPGEYSPVRIIELESGVEVQTYVGDLTNGKQFAIVAYDVFLVNDDTGNFAIFSESIPIGPFKISKKDDTRAMTTKFSPMI